jgi:hypothetical protein
MIAKPANNTTNATSQAAGSKNRKPRLVDNTPLPSPDPAAPHP